MILENLLRRLSAVSLIMSHAQQTGLSTSQKSGYHRSVTYLLCTIAEGFTFELVKAHSAKNNFIIDSKKEFREKHILPKTVLDSTRDSFICEKVKVDIKLMDDDVPFGKMLLYLKHKNIISDREYVTLNWVREERNKIHVQGLNHPDTGFTFKKIQRISSGIKILTAKLRVVWGMP